MRTFLVCFSNFDKADVTEYMDLIADEFARSAGLACIQCGQLSSEHYYSSSVRFAH